jgi:mannose-1-phosphate guanylyltransferase
MNAIIFAGGAGTRLWPLSRKNSPKQFEKVIGDKSTFQLSIERLFPDFKINDIYIATSKNYAEKVFSEIPDLNKNNIISEPEARDVGPAVALTVSHLYKKNPHEPMIFLWSDHYIRNGDLFRSIIKSCYESYQKFNNKIIFITQKPRFPSQNLGWIKHGKVIAENRDIKFFKFEDFIYRPDLESAKKFFQDRKYVWNIGYFITTPKFLWDQFKKHQPDIHEFMKKIYKVIGTKNYNNILEEEYVKLPKISFDNAILEYLSAEDSVVVSDDLGWSDVGAWEALKEALQSSPDQNITLGKVLINDSKDTLVYNYTDQLVVTIDLEGLLVINTKDAVLVCHKDSVPKIKSLVEKLGQSNNKHLI